MTNNSFLQLPDVPEEPRVDSQFEERIAALTRQIEAIQRIRQSQDWSTLKTEVFDSLSARLERELLDEAKNDDPNPLKLNRLSGELKWARRFSNLETWEKELRVELQNLKQRFHGKTE